MRTFWSNLGDPSLHLLVIALLVVYLAFGGRFSTDRRWAEAPLARCKVCRAHFLPGANCNCRPGFGIAGALD